MDKRLEAAEALINSVAPVTFDDELYFAWIHKGGVAIPSLRVIQEEALKRSRKNKLSRHDKNCYCAKE